MLPEPMCIDDESDEQVFPKEVPDICGKTFKWVYENRKEWVGFTKKWEKATGFFLDWLEYVKSKEGL
mgnify:CR=1 FL=1